MKDQLSTVSAFDVFADNRHVERGQDFACNLNVLSSEMVVAVAKRLQDAGPTKKFCLQLVLLGPDCKKLVDELAHGKIAKSPGCLTVADIEWKQEMIDAADFRDRIPKTHGNTRT